MSADSKKEVLKSIRQRKYLNKSFDSMRADLLEYAKTYYGDRLKDFSEASMGGLLLDFAAYVGDVQSFYMDHQFSELDIETAVETDNIERHIRTSGVEIVGASPAVVRATFYVEVPATIVNNQYVPLEEAIPIIQEGSVFTADNGTSFNLVESIDFSARDRSGILRANIILGETRNGIPDTFIMSRAGICVSGEATYETFTIGNDFTPFREISLSNSNATEITSVTDTYGNVFYEVNALTQDVVYRGVSNGTEDEDDVQETLEIVPAPYRFTKAVDLSTRTTTLTFGGGSADSLHDDVIPDPSEFAIPLYGKKTFPRLVINPDNLLQTNTLGIATVNTTYTCHYRHGGGLSHNIEAGTLRDVTTLRMTFPGNPSPTVAAAIRSSTEVTNLERGSGGEDSPTIDELKERVPAQRNAQSRVVTKEDLLSRIYTMPSNFGRVFRAGIRPNQNNPLATQLFIISRNENKQLIISPDTLKKNLRIYLNSFRLLNDAIDILDARVLNLKLNFDIVTDPNSNKTLILQNILAKLKKYFDIKNFQIDQPIVINEITNLIFNHPGVVSVSKVEFVNISGTVNNRQYSDETFDVRGNTKKGIIIIPPGSIIEIRHPDVDIVGHAT